VLRGSGTFEWGSEQQEAFDALKEFTQKLPTLVSPQPYQPLILYIFATYTAVNGALVQERGISNGDKKTLRQSPIYFFQSLGRLKKVLFRNGEDMLCSSHECKKVVTLL
jgi:hypothetical protein